MKDNKGFSAPIIILLLTIITSVWVGIHLLTIRDLQPKEARVSLDISKNQVKKVESPSPSSETNSDEPPLKLKSIGINFEDFKFTKAKLQFGRVFMGFGFYIPSGDAAHPAKNNPQPTFIVPLGTPVRSLVDGIVANVGTVWSGDYSVQVTADGKIQKWIYETEHVLNPKVKKGDKVTAGQIVGEVSTFSQAPPGYGTVEIGILKGGNPPMHVCPFLYLDESIKMETLAKITAIFKDWEQYLGDETLYDESLTIPGCLTLDPIPG